PSRVSHLPAVGRGDGLPSRPDPPGEPATGRGAADGGGGRALRSVPWLHGVHDRVPVRSAVRPDHRGGAGGDRGSRRGPRGGWGARGAGGAGGAGGGRGGGGGGGRGPGGGVGARGGGAAL